MEDKRFDVVIVGAGVAGSAMAHALATIPRQKPWSVALIERSFSEPERPVGEALQPGGVEAIRELGMESALDNNYAILLEGYLLVNGSDSISLPYKKGNEGRTFHHGKFVMGLRRVALQNANVQPIEATATKLIECPFTGRVTGVAVTRQSTSTDDPKLNLEEAARLKVYGDLVIIADGAFSKFRQAVLQDAFYKPEIYSYLVGAVMQDTLPPIPGHPAVVLAEGLAPVFLIQLSDTDTRIGVDVPVPLPEDLQVCLLQILLSVSTDFGRRVICWITSFQSSPSPFVTPPESNLRNGECAWPPTTTSQLSSKAPGSRSKVPSSWATRGTHGIPSPARG